jgi:flagellar motor switch protein FliN/FliY
LKNLTEKQIKEMLNLAGDQEIQNTHIKKARFSLLQHTPVEEVKADISILNEIQLELEVELGSTSLNLKEVINLFEGEVITLDRLAGDTVDLMANKQWLASGEVLVLNEVLGIRISSFNKDGDISGKGVK